MFFSFRVAFTRLIIANQLTKPWILVVVLCIGIFERLEHFTCGWWASRWIYTLIWSLFWTTAEN